MIKKDKVIGCEIVLIKVLIGLMWSEVLGAESLNNLQPVSDTYVSQNNDSSNYGSNTTAFIGDSFGQTIIYLKYDVSSIPSGSNVTNVILTFEKSNTSHSGSMEVAIGERLGSWSENTVTWSNSSPTGDNLIQFPSIDTDLSFPSIVGNSQLESLVETWVNSSSSNNGISIGLNASYGSYISFYTKESSNNPIRLTVDYDPPDVSPEVTTNSPSNITQDQAAFHGSVNPNGSSTTAWFEWGTDTSYSNTTPSTDVGAGNSFVDYNVGVGGLNCGTTYHFRAVAENSGGVDHGSDKSFTTDACEQSAPSVVTNAADGISSDSATLNGSVNPNGASTTAWFEWGTSTSYGQATGAVSVGSGTSSQGFSRSISGLNCGVEYHYRAVAENSGGQDHGSDQTFTPLCPQGAPSVSTGSATNVTDTGATLNGSVNPNGASTTAWFEWGTSTSYGQATGAVSVGSGTSSQGFSRSISGLNCGTTYNFRAVAENSGGQDFGSNRQFTPSCTGSDAGHIVINEVYPGTPDYIEIYNPGSTGVELSGWTLVSTGGSTDSHTLPTHFLPAEQYVEVVENTGTSDSDTIFTGSNFNWTHGSSGSVLLSDASGIPVDFVRWGNSAALPPNGTTWTGAPATPASGSNVIGRDQISLDTNSNLDWCEQSQSPAALNDGCGDCKSKEFGEAIVTSSIFKEACRILAVGPDVDVRNGGDLGLEATVVVLRPGTGVDRGGILRVASNTEPEVTGNFRLTGGSLAGEALGPSNWEISVSPGSTISGNIQFETNNLMGSNAVTTMGYTWTWGNRETDFVEVGSVATDLDTHDVSINLAAPSSAGTYYILFGFNGEFSLSQVLSCDNWATEDAVVWHDGNDYHDLDSSRINFASEFGFVQDWTYRFNSGYENREIPVMPIKVIVE